MQVIDKKCKSSAKNSHNQHMNKKYNSSMKNFKSSNKKFKSSTKKCKSSTKKCRAAFAFAARHLQRGICCASPTVWHLLRDTCFVAFAARQRYMRSTGTQHVARVNSTRHTPRGTRHTHNSRQAARILQHAAGSIRHAALGTQHVIMRHVTMRVMRPCATFDHASNATEFPKQFSLWSGQPWDWRYSR